jgi:muconolactone delta-isomerase
MRILAIVKEISSINPTKMHDVLRAEAARVWALQKQDIIRELWFTRCDQRAVIMLECGTEAEAKEHLESLPLVRHACIEFELLPLRPYDAFDRLLDVAS